ncbi:MAG: dUTP diphosphatase [Clostridiales bacterium]|nr:dUTP diphosphatase [Clostridiales bacterium]
MTIKIKPLSDMIGNEIPLPEYATPGSAGMDLRACIENPIEIPPGAIAVIPTGISIALPSPEHVAYVFARSGLAIKHGIALANGVGVIDSDYRGEIRVGVINQSDTPSTVTRGERIAQLVVMCVCRPDLQVCPEIDETERGEGGFGSTGRL